MKTILISIIIILSAIYSHQKVKLVTTTENQAMLRATNSYKGNTSQHPRKVTYITLIEGSKEVYNLCNSICSEKGENTLYSEVTDFPDYGNIFRCQCGDNFTSWYKMNDLSELCIDILLGDSLFNDYFNMLGYDVSNCKCDALRVMLTKMIAGK